VCVLKGHKKLARNVNAWLAWWAGTAYGWVEKVSSSPLR